MRKEILPNFDPTGIQLDQIKKYAFEHWFRILLFGLVMYVILVKDINFQLSMNSAPEQEVVPDDFWEEEKLQVETAEVVPAHQNEKFSIMSSIAPVLDFLSEENTPEKKPVAAPVKKSKTNKANTFSNLTFVLSPDYAKRKNIPADVVQEKKDKVRNYVKRFAPIAVSEMKKYGIPASITLAQGLLESNVGESRLTRASKNHFGIKCFSKKCKKGHCSNFTDDTHKDFFRVYDNAWDSYRAHSEFLQGKRYRHLKELGRKNYSAWAHGLKKAGYATDKRYAFKLIQIIEELSLDQFDG